jgi:hypothetical protein
MKLETYLLGVHFRHYSLQLCISLLQRSCPEPKKTGTFLSPYSSPASEFKGNVDKTSLVLIEVSNFAVHPKTVGLFQR